MNEMKCELTTQAVLGSRFVHLRAREPRCTWCNTLCACNYNNIEFTYVYNVHIGDYIHTVHITGAPLVRLVRFQPDHCLWNLEKVGVPQL